MTPQAMPHAMNGSANGFNENSVTYSSARRRPKDEKIPFSPEVSLITLVNYTTWKTIKHNFVFYTLSFFIRVFINKVI